MKLVLFLNMGGASNLKECEIFLKNMFNDIYILGIKNRILRKFVAFLISKMRVKKMQENYKLIGGKSPLNEITKELCKRLNEKCLNEFENFKFDFVNLYVPPFASEVLKKYTLNKNDEIILFPLYPHHSKTTITSSLEVLKNEILRQNIKSSLKIIEFFYKNEIYNEMIISHILAAKAQFKAKTLIFSAHSLPLSIIKKGDLYEKHVNEHFEILHSRLKGEFDETLLSYQSKLGPVKWLEPSTEQTLRKLKNEAIIYPLSFCIDCSESVFELDIEYRKIASKNYFVVPCANFSEEFINFILQILRQDGI